MNKAEPVNLSGRASLRAALNPVPQAPTASTEVADRAAGADAATRYAPVDRGLTRNGTARRPLGRSLARALWIVTICVAVAALRLGRELLIPMVLALLIALVLS